MEVGKTFYRLIQGNVMNVLPSLGSESVNLICTSPPYWSLRDYGASASTIWGGSLNCEHELGSDIIIRQRGSNSPEKASVGNQKREVQGVSINSGSFCVKCGAWRGQLGLEPHPQMYIDHLIEICRELRRVLRKDGSFYLNMGDTYFGSGGAGGDYNVGGLREGQPKFRQGRPEKSNWLTPKQLMLIPSRTAIALQNDGWILRNDIVWNKPNHMPSSVRDRLSNSWEHVFHFVKSIPRTTWLLDIPHHDKSEWMWLSALIDGEGTMGISRNKREENHDVFSVYLTIANSCKELLDNVVKITGFGKVEIDSNFTNLQMYRWRVNNRQASTIIAEVYPYLIAKKEQARICLALQETNRFRGNNKGENRGPKPISEKEWLRKLELFELCQKAKREQVGFLEEPDIRRTSGCAKYWYDLDAIRQPHKGINPNDANYRPNKQKQFEEQTRKLYKGKTVDRLNAGHSYNSLGKNPSDFWSINTQPFKGAHFAVFPEALVEPIIKSSCPEWVCKKCGKPRTRIVKPTERYAKFLGKGYVKEHHAGQETKEKFKVKVNSEYETVGWSDCGCLHEDGWDSGVVLDPFCGSGTVMKMARDLGRSCIGIDIVYEYCLMAKERVFGKKFLDREVEYSFEVFG